MANLGRYQLRRRLGRGGMAEVFLARRKGPGGIEKQLVVKRIRRELARDSRFLDLFVREAYVDEGPTLRRWRARAQGRAAPIRKRTSHITVVVDSKDV